ncbi:hypothetical protein D3C76_849620 [compost metagenome]
MEVDLIVKITDVGCQNVVILLRQAFAVLSVDVESGASRKEAVRADLDTVSAGDVGPHSGRLDFVCN